MTWNTRWTAVGALVALAGLVVGVLTFWQAQRSVDARIEVIDAVRAPELDDTAHIAYRIRCVLNNAGGLGIALSSAFPYAVPHQKGLPDRPLTKQNADSMDRSTVTAEPGKQETFRVFAYLDRDFVEEGRREQAFAVPTTPNSGPSAMFALRIKFEATAVDGTHWHAESPLQVFTFKDSIAFTTMTLNQAVSLRAVSAPVTVDRH